MTLLRRYDVQKFDTNAILYGEIQSNIKDVLMYACLSGVFSAIMVVDRSRRFA